MAEWQYTTTMVADMLAVFLLQTLPPINSKPTLHTLLQTLKLLWKCSQKINLVSDRLGIFLLHFHSNTTNVSLRYCLSSQDRHRSCQHTQQAPTQVSAKILSFSGRRIERRTTISAIWTKPSFHFFCNHPTGLQEAPREQSGWNNTTNFLDCFFLILRQVRQSHANR